MAVMMSAVAVMTVMRSRAAVICRHLTVLFAISVRFPILIDLIKPEIAQIFIELALNIARFRRCIQLSFWLFTHSVPFGF